MTDQPWLAHYDTGVPHVINIPPIALPELLAQAAHDFPAAPAILFYGTTIRYAELDTLAWRCAAAFVRAGVMPGERVALVLPNTPQAVICFYGALRAGATVVLANPLHEAGALIRQVEDAQAASIMALSMFHPLIMRARARVSFARVIYTNLKEYLPATQRRLFTLLRQEREGHRVPEAEARRSLWLARMLEEAREQERATPVWPAPSPDQPAVILYTGGTTGEAKGVLHTHRSLVANALQTRAWVPDLRRGRERVLCALPFSHAYGMTACMNFAVALAAAMILLPTFETENVLHATRRSRPTVFPGVPPMYAALTDVKDVRDYGLASLRACLSGAAPLPVEVQESFERITRARLVEGYGLTEAGPVTHVNPVAGTHRHGFIGLPLPSTEAKIVDVTSGEDVPPGQIGELLVRGPQLMQGYWNRPAETAEVLTPDGWLRTGDLARMDADGFFQVIERKKEMIVAGRYNIYPRDVEEVLYEHPKVLEAAVAGIPRAEAGASDVKAFVVLRQGENATAEEIIQFLRERISSYKLPSAVEFRAALPRSLVGKVLRRVLVEGEQEPEGD
jgi:long-chain acyl-CoA synthetase